MSALVFYFAPAAISSNAYTAMIKSNYLLIYKRRF